MTRKRKLPIILLFPVLIIVIILGFIMFEQHQSSKVSKHDIEKVEPDKDEEAELDELVESKMSEMTLDQKIAQLLIVEAPSLTIDEQLSNRLKTTPYGGFILMENAYGTLEQTRQFVKDLRKASSVPLIISTDQEGGNVQRMHKITNPSATRIPYASVLGDIGSTSLAMEVGEVVGRELSAVGINVDYAPVLDVNSNPDNPIIGKRSFSSEPKNVTRFGLAFAAGLAKNYVTPVYKHFPGHGDTTVDSHIALPVVNKTRAELDEVELVPFKDAIEAGAEMIMVGHIALPQITGDNTPASLSYEITTKLLREELGFNGLVVTDGINMGALVKNYPDEEIYYRAVEAGADLLVLPRNPDLAISSIKSHISEERIDESVRRILHYKYGTMQNWELIPASNFASAENQAIVDKAK